MLLIEVLRCKDCDRLVIAVGRGHGGGKCSGQWTVIAECEHDDSEWESMGR